MSARGCRIIGCDRKKRKGQSYCQRHWTNLHANTRRRPKRAPQSVRLLPARVNRDWYLERALTEETRIWLAQREDRAELTLAFLAVAGLYRFGYLRAQGHSEEDGQVVLWSRWPYRPGVDEPEEIAWMSWRA